LFSGSAVHRLETFSHRQGESNAPTETGTEDAIDVAHLTRGMVRGDDAAYRTFHRCYFDRLWRYLLVATAGNEDTAREALQAAFIRVVRHIKVFNDEAIFWSWLTVLARSALFDHGRKRRRYFAFLDRFAREPEVDRVPPEIDESKLETRLSYGLAQLSDDDRKLLAWKYTEGRSVRSIADELQITDKAVESRLVRIRRKLKELMLADLKHE
jgi:RNA polymerase sigma-70 factor (ECF subfamily)